MTKYEKRNEVAAVLHALARGTVLYETTMSFCKDCPYEGIGRGGDPCLGCLTDKLDTLVGAKIAEDYIQASILQQSATANLRELRSKVYEHLDAAGTRAKE